MTALLPGPEGVLVAGQTEGTATAALWEPEGGSGTWLSVQDRASSDSWDQEIAGDRSGPVAIALSPDGVAVAYLVEAGADVRGIAWSLFERRTGALVARGLVPASGRIVALARPVIAAQGLFLAWTEGSEESGDFGTVMAARAQEVSGAHWRVPVGRGADVELADAPSGPVVVVIGESGVFGQRLSYDGQRVGGEVAIGEPHEHANIYLNDLSVSRIGNGFVLAWEGAKPGGHQPWATLAVLCDRAERGSTLGHWNRYSHPLATLGPDGRVIVALRQPPTASGAEWALALARLASPCAAATRGRLHGSTGE